MLSTLEQKRRSTAIDARGILFLGCTLSIAHTRLCNNYIVSLFRKLSFTTRTQSRTIHMGFPIIKHVI